jgi:hypothetical protein
MKPIKTESTNQALSSLGGLVLSNKVLNFLDLKKILTPLLPSQQFSRSSTSYDKFHAILTSFVAGAQCLDDIERLCRDPGFEAACGGKVNAANTYGDFLREFTAVQCRLLNDKAIENAMRLRSASHPECKEMIIDLDTTTHEQHGKKMEGLGWDYKGVWGLSGVHAFDQFGYQYWSDVRPGSTYSSVGAGEVISAVFKKAPSSKKVKRYFRADSAYCNTEVFNTCLAVMAKFVIAMKANMYNPLLGNIKKWEKVGQEKLQFHDGRAVEIGHTLYHPSAGHEVLRVVVLRAEKENVPENMIFERDRYDYVAWATNIGQHEKSDTKVVEFYRARGHCAENMIRELKNGFDLHHFPCQKLLANKAYGLIAAFAHNIVRFLSFIENPKKQHFSKLIRWKMISFPVLVVKHARDVIFRFSKQTYEEVQLYSSRIYIKLTEGLRASTA